MCETEVVYQLVMLWSRDVFQSVNVKIIICGRDWDEDQLVSPFSSTGCWLKQSGESDISGSDEDKLVISCLLKIDAWYIYQEAFFE